MSQSGLNYETEQSKTTAYTQRHQQKPASDTDSGTDPEPACRSRSVGHSVGAREWREIPYTERILVSYRPCSWPECYPDGRPDLHNVQTVVRSCRHPTTFHRPADGAESCEREQDGSETTDTFTVTQAAVHESLDSITDLRDGDGVIWAGQTTPMLVVDSTASSTEVVNIVGPGGGDYRIEERPDKILSYAIYPGYGCQREITRVELPNEHSGRV